MVDFTLDNIPEDVDPLSLDWSDGPAAPQAQQEAITLDNFPKDVDPLSLDWDAHGYQGPEVSLGENFQRGLERVGPMLRSATAGVMQSVGEEGIENRDPESFSGKFNKALAEKGKAQGKVAAQELQDLPVRAKDGSLGYYVGHGTSMLFGQMLPLIGASIAAGPSAGLAVMTGQVYGDKYRQARQEGRTTDEASMDGVFYALAEVVPERLFLGTALKEGTKFWARVGGSGAVEGGTELLTSLAQRLYDLGVVEEDTPIPEVLRRMADEEALREYRDSLILGGAAGAGISAAVHPIANRKKGETETDTETDTVVEEEDAPPPLEPPVEEETETEVEEPPPIQEESGPPPVEEPGDTIPQPPTEPVLEEPTEPVTVPEEPVVPIPQEAVPVPEPEPEVETKTPEVSPVMEKILEEEAFIQEQLRQIQQEQADRVGPPLPQVPEAESGVPAFRQEHKQRPGKAADVLPFLMDDTTTITNELAGYTPEELADLIDTEIGATLDEYAGGQVPNGVRYSIQRVQAIADKFRDGVDLTTMDAEILSQISTDPNVGRMIGNAFGTNLGRTLQKAPPGTVITAGFRGRPGTDTFPRRMRNILQGWVKAYAPGQRVVLVDADVWSQVTHNTEKFLGMHSGSVWESGNGLTFIRVDPSMMSKAAKRGDISEKEVMTLAHEFGHMLSLRHFQEASPEMQQAILDDYQSWLRKQLRVQKWGTIRDFLTNRSPAVNTRMPGIQKILDRKGEGVPIKDPAYLLSLEEYLAEQVARFAQHDPTMQGVVKQFFKSLYEKMRKFFNQNRTHLPAKSVADWMDSLRYKARLVNLEQAKIESSDVGQLLASGHGNAVRAGLKRFDKAVGGPPILQEQGQGSKDDMFGDPELGPKGEVSNARALVRFGRMSKALLTLTQVEDRNRDVPGVTRYTNAVRKWWGDKNTLTRMADIRAHELLRLSKTDREMFSKFVTERTLKSDELKRGLTTKEQAELAEKLNITLSEEAQSVLKGTDQDFKQIVEEIYDVLEKDLQRRYKHLDPIDREQVITEKTAELKKERSRMKNMNYWPLSRFGRFWVQARTKEKASIQGRNFKKGEVFLFEVFETEAEAKKRHAQVKRTYGEAALVGGSQFSDRMMSFQGMPPQMVHKLRKMIEEKALDGVSDPVERDARMEIIKKELTGLDEVLHELAPGNSFKNRMQRRKRTPGYTLDAIRAYSSYMQGAANHISRIKNYGEMMDALDELKMFKIRTTNETFNKEVGILEDHLRTHYEYAMNPGEEWSHLRAVGFLWYLGFNLKSATVNLSQVPMFTAPYLGKRYGTPAMTKELSRAMLDLRKLIEGGKGVEPELERAIKFGQEMGFIEESQATELAGLAEGSNLQRLLPGSFLKSEAAARAVRTASHWGAWMFQKVEQMNRYQTFMAAFRLHRNKMLKEMEVKAFKDLTPEQQKIVEEEATVTAREAIEKTQFEYARWNRPAFMRGRWSSIFLFKMYTQNALYFVATDPAKWRYLAVLGVLAGAMGLPGSDDLSDGFKMMMAAARKATGREDLVTPDQAQVREFLKDLGQNPDLWLNGTSHELFHLWDLSGSIGQGRIIPGIDPLKDVIVGGATSREKMGQAFKEIVGPAWGIPIQLVESLTSDSPDRWREFEKAMPKAMANVSKAYRMGSRGYASDYTGNPIDIAFDPTDEQHSIELAGQALGFIPERLSEARERNWAQKETVNYWLGRKKIISRQFVEEALKGTRESKADILKAVRDFNRIVPDKSLMLTGKSLSQSVSRKAEAMLRSGKGLPKGRQGIQTHQKFRNAWEESAP